MAMPGTEKPKTPPSAEIPGLAALVKYENDRRIIGNDLLRNA
jgi:hypothetical protein